MNENPCYVYILFSHQSQIYYVGSTEDYKRRLLEHNSTLKNKFTSKHAPWELKLVLLFKSRSEAMKFERMIKKQKSKLFIQKIIEGNNLTGELAQLVRVPHLRD